MPRPKSRDGGLTRERIIETALALVDKYGFEALTMRRLAGVLGVDPMAIYHHVEGRAGLLVELARHVYAGLDAPLEGEDWREQVMAFADRYVAVTRAHAGLVLHVLTDVPFVKVASALANPPLYDALSAAGLSQQQAMLASAVIVDYLNGYALAGVAVDAVGYRDGLALILDGVVARCRRDF